MWCNLIIKQKDKIFLLHTCIYLFKSKTLALLFPCVTVPVFKKIQHWLYAAATVAWSGTVKIDQQKRHAKNTNLSMNFEFQRVGKINKNV